MNEMKAKQPNLWDAEGRAYRNLYLYAYIKEERFQIDNLIFQS